MTQTEQLGYQNSTLKAVGGEDGLEQLVEQFYTIMDTAEYAREIRAMHPQDLTLAKQKLTTFLTGWMGGPRRYAEKFGQISIPGSHAHFDIKERHRDAWLGCMNDALIEKSIPNSALFACGDHSVHHQTQQDNHRAPYRAITRNFI